MSRFIKLGVTKFARSADATFRAVRLVRGSARLATVLRRLASVFLVPLALTCAWAGGVMLAPACTPQEQAAIAKDVSAVQSALATPEQIACLFANHVPFPLPPAEAEADAALVALCGLLPASAPAALHIVHDSQSSAAALIEGGPRDAGGP